MAETTGIEPTDPLIRTGRRAPWDEGQDNAWDVYGAWTRWMAANLDDALPEGTAAIRDTLDGVQEAHLYNLMTRLACGVLDAPAWRPVAPGSPASPEIALVMVGGFYAVGLLTSGRWRLYDGTPIDPSHWMPLPSPPAGRSEVPVA